jgi:hypothetical protein
MAGEKAKENSRLTAACAVCGKEMSVELLTGKVTGEGRDRRIVALCDPCLEKGWPPAEESPGEKEATAEDSGGEDATAE